MVVSGLGQGNTPFRASESSDGAVQARLQFIQRLHAEAAAELADQQQQQLAAADSAQAGGASKKAAAVASARGKATAAAASVGTVSPFQAYVSVIFKIMLIAFFPIHSI